MRIGWISAGVPGESHPAEGDVCCAVDVSRDDADVVAAVVTCLDVFDRDPPGR
jgi:hypothetical protein